MEGRGYELEKMLCIVETPFLLEIRTTTNNSLLVLL